MKTPEQLADEHWNYVRGVIEQENDRVEFMVLSLNDYIAKIEYHFKTALIHGFKHGAESTQANGAS